jgi:hypothetical protein
MPEELEVSGAGEGLLTLSAFHHAWYQDVILPDAGSALRNGAAWYADRSEGRLQWMLTGRDLYVLGPRDDLSGYVSTPRLVLGEQHAVICITELREQVLALLQECCDTTPLTIEPEDGLPTGWVGFRNVCPIRAVPQSSSADILDALRPDLDIQIHLRAGIRLRHSQWLIGFPPAIRLVGAAADAQPAATIDGRAAVWGADGALTAPGWDQPGEHLVACEALTRSYSLVAPPDSWEAWPAHRQWGTLAICGPAVGEISAGTVNPGIVVPATNPWLIGQLPGQIYFCRARSDIQLGVSCGTPPFRPVWAIPAAPLQSNKLTARILVLDLVGGPAVLEQSSVGGASVRRWFQVVLDCARKGLRLSNESPTALAVWRACCDRARAIWRRTR